MMKKEFILLALGVTAGILLSEAIPRMLTYEQRRMRVIDSMDSAIRDKAYSGEYRCCIEPPCDMCFLGHWLWDDGACRCDDMIARGEYDKVCPQCAKALEDGACESSAESACEVVA